MRERNWDRFFVKHFYALLAICLTCFILTGCSSGGKITESIIKDSLTDDLRSYSYADFAEVGKIHVLNVDKVSIESQTEENGGQAVYAEVLMSDDVFSAKAYYKLLYRKGSDGWRLDQASEYKASEFDVKAEPSEDKVRAYYQEKYGDLKLLESKKDDGKYIYHYQYLDEHTYLTIRGTIEVIVAPGKAQKEAKWYSDATESERDTEWNVEGKWCYYFSCTPETYGKSTLFSDSRYEYTIRKENGQFVFTVDRYKCEPGETEKFDKSKEGTAKIYDGKSPELSCYNEFTSTSLIFSMDDVRQAGLGVNDAVYPVR